MLAGVRLGCVMCILIFSNETQNEESDLSLHRCGCKLQLRFESVSTFTGTVISFSGYTVFTCRYLNVTDVKI